VVEGINDTEEIVVKPLGKQLKGLTVFAGATIMGNGKVALILDVMGIARHAHVVSEVRDRELAEAEKRAQNTESGEARQTLSLFTLDRIRKPNGDSVELGRSPRGVSEEAGGESGPIGSGAVPTAAVASRPPGRRAESREDGRSRRPNAGRGS
jgi:two-component system chemotaxis sensor kinase CheA